MHPKMVIFLGGSVSLGGVFLASFVEELVPFVLLYCVLNGLGCGTCYMVPLICGWEWYPERKGIVTGLIVGGYGFGSFIFANVSTSLVNPHGVQADVYDAKNDVTYFGDEVADRVPYMIRTLAFIWAVFVLIAICMISRKEAEADTGHA